MVNRGSRAAAESASGNAGAIKRKASSLALEGDSDTEKAKVDFVRDRSGNIICGGCGVRPAEHCSNWQVAAHPARMV